MTAYTTEEEKQKCDEMMKAYEKAQLKVEEPKPRPRSRQPLRDIRPEIETKVTALWNSLVEEIKQGATPEQANDIIAKYNLEYLKWRNRFVITKAKQIPRPNVFMDTVKNAIAKLSEEQNGKAE